VKLLFDTHLLLWAAGQPDRLPRQVRAMLENPLVEPVFSPVSLWEVSIKAAMGRSDFTADPRLLRRGLLDNGYLELPINSAHAVAVGGLPPLHKDPFDRMLVAQSIVEGIALITVDAKLGRYEAPVQVM
jgi:PIN domain nuclease of toxin-antitoxin system